MNTAAAIGFGMLGVPVGSFLNVVIDRVPNKHRLRGTLDGEAVAPVEVLGVATQPWLLRRGKDDASLPRRWLWVELLTATVFALLGGRYGNHLIVAPLLLLGASLVAVSVIDLQVLRIPDRITFPTLALSVPLVVVVSARSDALDAVQGALLGAVAYFLALLIPHLIYPRGMGFGDVKLALVMGLYVGWLGWTEVHPVGGPVQFVLYALMLGCALGVVFGVLSALITRRREEFPFGPALALGCLIVVLFASDLRL